MISLFRAKIRIIKPCAVSYFSARNYEPTKVLKKGQKGLKSLSKLSRD